MSLTRLGKSARWALPTFLLTAPFCGPLLTAHATPPAVLTQHNDNARTGANLSETALTTSNVNVNQFGKLFTRTLDANVNGQVLYVPNLTIGGITRNVIFAYTSNNADNSPSSVYAFDADDPAASAPLWRHQFTANAARWTTCTPVIDSANKIIYVVTKDTNNSGLTKLHALDLLTGNEKTGSPITVAASVPGTGDGSNGGVVTFDSAQANCRPGLLLLNGVVYFAFAHNTDSYPYHGWVFGYSYNGTQFTQTAVYNTAPDGGDAGIWQAGKGLAADGNGNIYLGTGNGSFTANSGGTAYGMSYIKLATPALTVLDYFAPYDESPQSAADLDLNNTGLLNIPGTNRVFGGATKFGSVFLLDSTNMGGFTSGGPDKAVQRFNGVSSNSNVGQNPVAWDASASSKYVYLWPKNGEIKQYNYDASVAKFNPAGVWKQTNGFTNGGSLAISANNGANGILWAIGYNSVFHAFDASDLSKTELWNSNQNGARDNLGSVGKWQFPTITNGKVYAPTGSGTIVAYGLLQQTPPTPTTLTPTADSFIIAGAYAGNNFGSSKQFQVRKATNDSSSIYNRASYLKFDLSSVTVAPSSAVLSLSVSTESKPTTASEQTQFYYVPTNTWTESAINWNNAPGLNRTNFTSTGTLIATKSIALVPGTVVSLDLTSFVAAHLGQVVTIQLIDATNEDVSLGVLSKENANGKPQLVITP